LFLVCHGLSFLQPIPVAMVSYGMGKMFKTKALSETTADDESEEGNAQEQQQADHQRSCGSDGDSGGGRGGGGGGGSGNSSSNSSSCRGRADYHYFVRIVNLPSWKLLLARHTLKRMRLKHHRQDAALTRYRCQHQRQANCSADALHPPSKSPPSSLPSSPLSPSSPQSPPYSKGHLQLAQAKVQLARRLIANALALVTIAAAAAAVDKTKAREEALVAGEGMVSDTVSDTVSDMVSDTVPDMVPDTVSDTVMGVLSEALQQYRSALAHVPMLLNATDAVGRLAFRVRDGVCWDRGGGDPPPQQPRLQQPNSSGNGGTGGSGSSGGGSGGSNSGSGGSGGGNGGGGIRFSVSL
jgi:uncharacterized membrane protein YgcG